VLEEKLSRVLGDGVWLNIRKPINGVKMGLIMELRVELPSMITVTLLSLEYVQERRNEDGLGGRVLRKSIVRISSAALT
jgi:hypothetical protein